MVFFPHSQTSDPVGTLPSIPDTVSIPTFMFDEQYGRAPYSTSLDTYTCALSRRGITATQQRDRVEALARGIAARVGWKVNCGSEFDKVACVFALNTVDNLTVAWAIQRLNGVCSPANASSSPEELAHQLRDSGAKLIFTVDSLLHIAAKACEKANIDSSHIWVCEMAGDNIPAPTITVSQLVRKGELAPALEPIRWEPGQGARQIAFLCYSSGTSGQPKGVMISHRNVIVQILQLQAFEAEEREQLGHGYRDVVLGLLPQSHIYGLMICHASTYRGDQVIILPRFKLESLLQSVQKYKINSLYIVPPIVIQMINNRPTIDKYRVHSVRKIVTGAAPLGTETAEKLATLYPASTVRQAYGLTETTGVVCWSRHNDNAHGSCGLLLPGYRAKLIDPSGAEVTKFNQRGELLLSGPSIVLGYHNRPEATKETFLDMSDGRFMRTGDIVELRVSPQGYENVWVVDRIKELIKVKGFQVAPAELEAFLLSHEAVADCAVVPVPDPQSGEVPRAFVVKSVKGANSGTDAALQREICQFVESSKARYKWLAGGVEFIDAIPKTASGKIIRRILRDRVLRPNHAKI